MKILMILMLSLLAITSCASYEVSNDTKYKIAKVPPLKKADMVVFLDVIVATSKLSEKEKSSLMKEIEVMGTELLLMRATMRKTIVAYLMSLDKGADKKSRSELKNLVNKIAQEEHSHRAKMISTVSNKLEDNVDLEKLKKIKEEMIKVHSTKKVI